MTGYSFTRIYHTAESHSPDSANEASLRMDGDRGELAKYSTCSLKLIF